MNKKVLLSVTSDLVTDQRVNRSASALTETGYRVTVIGRRLKKSAALHVHKYEATRFQLWWEKGPLFYMAYNFRLFIYLLSNHADILFSNDLDTLLPNYLVSKIKGIPLVYDSHEYFTGVPELQNRKFIRSIWKTIERMIVPRLKYAITVNQSIADLYDEEYHTKFVVVRNMPIQNQVVLPSKEEMKDKLGLPADKKIIILQGAGINIDRGAEEVVKAMRFFDDVLLLIVGDGDVVPSLKLYVEEYQLQHKVRFFPKQNYEQLLNYTLVADLGVSLDKDSNMNYRFSLPNKIFDYIQAEIPLLVSNLTEVRRIVEQYDIGVVSMTHDPAKLASLITQTVNNEQQLKRWKQNLIQAKKELTWKHEKIQFNKLIASIGK